ncbi:MAG: hypothetical protein ACO34E_15415 [Limisphaerales bacterium]
MDRTLVYRLRSGGGTEFWLPITAVRNDVQEPGDLLPETEVLRSVGLWVGEVVVNGVTSLVRDGAPVENSAGGIPLRVLLHSDESGNVSMLSAVTLMKRRTADASVEAVPVLVVDPAKIPFFEGIQERGGKKAGVRLEAVAYDMPRRMDATSQAALLSDEAYLGLGLTAESIEEFLVTRQTRPPSLSEVYHLTWPMEGAIGAGKTVRTASARPLVLDPFHRSNPLRHAYHQSHSKGPEIRREFVFVFEPEPQADGVLRGSYTEIVNGLIQSELRSSGTIQLRRVSTVAHLE